MKFLAKPVEQEFFTKFIAIFSRDSTGNAVAVRLTPKNIVKSNSDGHTVYCDKIRIGETIDTAIKRTLQQEFGLDLVYYYIPIASMDVEKNKRGTPVTRIPIVAYTSFGTLARTSLVGCQVEWIERDLYAYSSCEALQWIQKNKQDALFTQDSHSIQRHEMIDFIKNLYAAGAVDITIHDTSQEYCEPDEDITEPFEPDHIEILLPQHVEKRDTIKSVCLKGIRGGTSTNFDISSEKDYLKFYFH